jgi:hypothetical protein
VSRRINILCIKIKIKTLHSLLEEFEGVIRIRKSKKNRQYNGQKTEGQTTQWPKEKGQKNKQRSTKHYT